MCLEKSSKWPFCWFEHGEATQLLYPRSLQVWILGHQGILCQDNSIFEFNCCILHQTYFYSMSKGLTSSSQTGRMTSQSASHHAESNSTKILLFVPKPNLWMECILLRGRGGENSVEWCFFRKPKKIIKRNKRLFILNPEEYSISEYSQCLHKLIGRLISTLGA